MSALRELQAAFAGALLGGDPSLVAEAIAGDGLAPEARLDIYRHHVFATLTATLESTFPVLCRLVDRRFFAYAADRFIRAHPPTGPCLFEYGHAFGDFLERFPASRDRGYLADVARLEWAMNAARHAVDVPPLGASALAAVAEADLDRLVLRLDPSVTILASPWPIDRIWRANQEGADPDLRVDLGDGPVRLEVRRAGDAVTMRRLDPADHALRRALALGQTLEEAAAAALDADDAFDLAAALRDLLDERILVGAAVSN